MSTSDAEEIIERALIQHGPDGWQREHRVVTGRRWRWDFAWPACKVAVEIQGGHWSQGRHTRGAGYEKDLIKNRAATLSGWAVLHYTATDARRRAAAICEEIGTLCEIRNGST